jgi:hypothetical protein
MEVSVEESSTARAASTPRQSAGRPDMRSLSRANTSIRKIRNYFLGSILGKGDIAVVSVMYQVHMEK